MAVSSETSLTDFAPSDFGFMMIRPDGLDLGLDQAVITRIEDTGLTVIKRVLAPINADQIDTIYDNVRDREYFPEVRQSLDGRMVMSLVVAGTPSVQDQLLELKGSSRDIGGTIRGDYSLGHLIGGELHEKYTQGAIDATTREHPGWIPVMRENRVHCDDTPLDAAKAIQTMLPPHEISETSARFPGLISFLHQHSW